MLKVNKLCKSYGEFSLKEVSFNVEKGYITGFIGQNGAGKTTVVKAILNLIKKDSGDINILGLDSEEKYSEIKKRVGIVMDDGIFYDHLTLKETKGINSSFYDNWDEESYRYYMDKFKLDENQKIRELSKGMRMKYSLVMAFSHNAEFFIMDEPTSGLDPIVREELLDVLQEIIEEGQKSVFFSTHITTDLEKVADFLILIDDGKILLNDSKDGIINSHVIVKGGKDALNDEIREKAIYIYEREHGFEALIIRDKMNTEGYICEKPTIEDIMRFYVKKEERERKNERC